MAKPLIIANWKMNPQTLRRARLLFNSVKAGVKKIKNIKVIICPPFVYLPSLKSKILNLKLGAQDCFWEERGAFTGEISAKMLKNLGVKYIILGHSERRKYQKETDGEIKKKIKVVVKEGMKPILCIKDIYQVERDLGGIFKNDFKKIILAYEPTFAIGTGRPCSIEKARKMRILIKKKIRKSNLVLYGGSVDSKNAKDYLKKAGFQGLLIGGASLNPKEFIKIIKNISKLT
jgi:triosephosphate isomerase